MAHSVLKGTIPADGLASRLREIEETRTTGVLRFRAGGREGSVRLVQGQLGLDQPAGPHGDDPVEVLLDLREGEFEVLQELPPLPVSSGDSTHRRGSLQVHVAADLMNYCERAGLTGWLVLEHSDGDRAEIAYAGGELSGIRLQGPDELHEVFGWNEGHFEVEATHVDEDAFTSREEPLPEEPLREPVQAPEQAPEQAPMQKPAQERDDPTLPRVPRSARREATARSFLRVVETSLAQIVRDREEHRPADRTGPPLPPMPAARESVPAPEPPEEKRAASTEVTIPIVYIDPSSETPSMRPGVRHVKRGDISAEVVLPEASPERRSEPRGRLDGHMEERKADAMSDEGSPKATSATKAKSADEPTDAKASADAKAEPSKELPASVWAVVALLVVLLALVVLSALPRFD